MSSRSGYPIPISGYNTESPILNFRETIGQPHSMITSLLLEVLVLKAPSVQITSPGAEVSREAQPAEIRHHAVGGDPVDRPPDARQVDVQPQKRDNINGSLDGALQAEEEWHPRQVEAELDGVQRRGVLRVLDQLRRGRQGVEARGYGAVGGVAHQPVEDRPRRAEDIGWWAEGRLLNCVVGLLGLLCCAWLSERVVDQWGRSACCAWRVTYGGYCIRLLSPGRWGGGWTRPGWRRRRGGSSGLAHRSSWSRLCWIRVLQVTLTVAARLSLCVCENSVVWGSEQAIVVRFERKLSSIRSLRVCMTTCKEACESRAVPSSN